MKDELNNLQITNPDGASTENFDCERKLSFDNDKPHSVAEDSSRRVEEWDCSVPEDSSTSRDAGERRSDEMNSSDTSGSDGGDYGGGDATASSSSSSAASSASSSAAASASTASAAASAAGGIGAMAGVVTTAVVASVVMVVAFVSMMTINIRLTMAEMTRLIFQVEINGAQEEDFAEPIIALLYGEDGYASEQEIRADTAYLTYEDLAPGKEYTLKVYNSEKVFYNGSFFTATHEVDRGSVEMSVVDGEVSVYVQNLGLRQGEYYTLTVKDADGRSVFVKDSVDGNAQYRFAMPDTKALYCTVSVNGTVYAMSEVNIARPEPHEEPDPTPVYDWDGATWVWDGVTSATLSVADTKGGSPLSLVAVVIEEIVTYPDCETEGVARYTASVTYGDRAYEDAKTQALEAYGHTYSSKVYRQEPTCFEEGNESYYRCVKCNQYFDTDKNPVSRESLVLPREHTFGAMVEAIEPGCESEGRAAYYQCAYCGSYFDEDKEPVESLDDLVISAAGHEYGELIPEDYNSNGLAAHYECSVCHKLFDEDHVEKAAEELAIGDGTGLYVSRITTDMLPGTDKPTADLFPGFQATTWETISAYEFESTGITYVIYAFSEEGFFVCTFIDGVHPYDDGPIHDTNTTNSLFREYVDVGGYTFFYTAAEGTLIEEPQPAEPVAVDLVAISASNLSVSDESEYVSADAFQGFYPVTWATVSTMNVDYDGACYVIYAFSQDIGFYVCAFYNGVCNAQQMGARDNLSYSELKSFINEGAHYYYTVAEGTVIDEPQSGDIDVVRITAEMVPNDNNHPSASLFAGFTPSSADAVRAYTPNHDCYVIINFDEEGFYVVAFRDGAWDANDIHDTETTNAVLLEMIMGGDIFYYTTTTSQGGSSSGGQGQVSPQSRLMLYNSFDIGQTVWIEEPTYIMMTPGYAPTLIDAGQYVVPTPNYDSVNNWYVYDGIFTSNGTPCSLSLTYYGTDYAAGIFVDDGEGSQESPFLLSLLYSETEPQGGQSGQGSDQSGEPSGSYRYTLLTSSLLFEGLNGMQVVLKTADNSYGVSLGTERNTTTNMDDLTMFDVLYVDTANGGVVLRDSATNRYLSLAGVGSSHIRFESESIAEIRIGDDGKLLAVDGNTSDMYQIRYNSFNDIGVYLTASPFDSDLYVYMYVVTQELEKVTLENLSAQVGKNVALQTADGAYCVYLEDSVVAEPRNDRSAVFTIYAVDDFRVFLRMGSEQDGRYINLNESTTTLTVNETYSGNYLEVDADGRLSFVHSDPQALEPEYITCYLMYDASAQLFRLSPTEVGPYVYMFILPDA